MIPGDLLMQLLAGGNASGNEALPGCWSPRRKAGSRVRMKISASSCVSTTGTFPICAQSLAGSEGQSWVASLSLGILWSPADPLASLCPPLGACALLLSSWGQAPLHGCREWGVDLATGQLPDATPCTQTCKSLDFSLFPYFWYQISEKLCEHIREIQLVKQEQKDFAPQNLKKDWNSLE